MLQALMAKAAERRPPPGQTQRRARVPPYWRPSNMAIGCLPAACNTLRNRAHMSWPACLVRMPHRATLARTRTRARLPPLLVTIPHLLGHRILFYCCALHSIHAHPSDLKRPAKLWVTHSLWVAHRSPALSPISSHSTMRVMHLPPHRAPWVEAYSRSLQCGDAERTPGCKKELTNQAMRVRGGSSGAPAGLSLWRRSSSSRRCASPCWRCASACCLIASATS